MDFVVTISTGNDMHFTPEVHVVLISIGKKWMLHRGGNRTRDLWFAGPICCTSPILCQLSYEVMSTQAGD